MKLTITALVLVLLTGCASLNGRTSLQDRILNCTERLADKTDAHIVDSSNVCMKVYAFEKKPRSE